MSTPAAGVNKDKEGTFGGHSIVSTGEEAVGDGRILGINGIEYGETKILGQQEEALELVLIDADAGETTAAEGVDDGGASGDANGITGGGRGIHGIEIGSNGRRGEGELLGRGGRGGGRRRGSCRRSLKLGNGDFVPHDVGIIVQKKKKKSKRKRKKKKQGDGWGQGRWQTEKGMESEGVQRSALFPLFAIVMSSRFHHPPPIPIFFHFLYYTPPPFFLSKFSPS